jgi:hypothetical protein
MKEDIPLPFHLPAAALKYVSVSRLQAVNDCFRNPGITFRRIRNVAFPPNSAARAGYREGLLRGMSCHRGRLHRMTFRVEAARSVASEPVTAYRRSPASVPTGPARPSFPPSRE